MCGLRLRSGGLIGRFAVTRTAAIRSNRRVSKTCDGERFSFKPFEHDARDSKGAG